MTTQPLEFRVDSLEDRVTQLEQQVGPDDRDPSQVVALRTEMRAEFSAVRAHLASLDAKVGGLEAKMGGLDAKVGSLESKLEAKIDQQGIQMRVLHEEVIRRIALIGESAPSSRKPRKK